MGQKLELTGYLFFRTRFGYPNSMRSRGPYGKRLRRDSSFMSPGNYKIKMIYIYFLFIQNYFFQVVNFAEMAAKGHALLNRIENITTDQERSDLKVITGRLVFLEIFYSSLEYLQSFIHTIIRPCTHTSANSGWNFWRIPLPSASLKKFWWEKTKSFFSKEFMKIIRKISKPSSSPVRMVEEFVIQLAPAIFPRTLSLKPVAMDCQSFFYFIFWLEFLKNSTSVCFTEKILMGKDQNFLSRAWKISKKFQNHHFS